jgi:hypothetical protein
MAIRARMSDEDLHYYTVKAQELFGARASKAFQLGTQAAITIDGLTLVHDDDSDAFYLVRRYLLIGGTREADLDIDTTPIYSIGDFEDCA